MFAYKYGSAFHLTADPAEGIQDAVLVGEHQDVYKRQGYTYGF